MDKNLLPFPQADDINKIFKIININDPIDLTNVKKMEIILGDITDRQVSYYRTAAMYLNIIDKDKKFTSFGLSLRNMNDYEQKINLATQILTNSVFSEVFITQLFLGIKLEKIDVIDIMKKYVKFDSEQLYVRRAGTVISWVEWISSMIQKD